MCACVRVCIPAGSVCVATGMRRKYSILRCTDSPPLLHNNTEQHHYKGDQTSTNLSAKLQKRQRSRKVAAKCTQLSTN